MPRFFIDMDGAEPDAEGADLPSLDHARNAAIERLGAYLQQNPDFAYARHWRVDLKDGAGRLLLHVVVATVEAPLPINKASFET